MTDKIQLFVSKAIYFYNVVVRQSCFCYPKAKVSTGTNPRQDKLYCVNVTIKKFVSYA